MNITPNQIVFSVLCFIFFCSVNLFGQEKDYSSIDRFAKNAPPGVSRLYKPLTHYLTDRYSTDDEKVRSISVWIVNNIKYDTKVIRTDNRKKHSPNKILSRRKAICQGYCDLFEAMCIEAGVDARTIVGYDKGGTYEPTDIFVRDDHCWSAANVDGGWQLMDLTWASGYVVPRQQIFRRLLYFFLNVPFKQKYRFVKKVNYNYCFVQPDTFAIDHLPTYPWWQLTTEKSILTFEKDSTVKKHNTGMALYAEPSPGSIPDMDKSEAPIDYLKKAEIAFKFNPKNYRVLAEGKAIYSYKWYKLTKKSKIIENKEKVEIYDSCKTVVDEAKDAMKSYIMFTSKERDVRKHKNKEYNKEAKDYNKYQKKKIAIETQKNYATINSIDREIDKLKTEKRSIRNELSNMNGLKLPERKNTDKELNQLEYNSYSSRYTDSIDILKRNLSLILSKNKDENFYSIKQNEKSIDSIIGVSCDWIYRKIIYRVFFDWNYKIAVDTLQYQHNVLSNIKDSMIFLQMKQMKEVAENDKIQADQSNQIRSFYFQKLKFNYSVYATCKDTIIKALNIKDSCKAVKTEWREWNNLRLGQNDKEIQQLKNKKRSIAAINRKLRVEKWYNNKEIYFEGKRYKHFNRYYFRFYRREKKKAVVNYKKLSELKKEIQLENSSCKEKVREEEKKEREDNKVQGKTK